MTEERRRDTRAISVEEHEALALLSRRHRLLVVLVPRGVPGEEIKRLTREIDARLEQLVAERGPLT